MESSADEHGEDEFASTALSRMFDEYGFIVAGKLPASGIGHA